MSYGLHLIIMGNKNVNTFANTLRAVENHWKSTSVSEVHLIRIEAGNDTTPNWPNLCNTLLRVRPRYHEYSILDTTGLATELPNILSQILVQKNDRGAIIVDLTNGTKTWCDFVYLICTLMQITKLFRVKVPRECFELPFNEVGLDLLKVQFEPILNGDDLQRLVRSTYSEYGYYLEEVTKFINWASNESLITFDFAKLYTRLLKSFEHYMRGDFDSCIVSVATILEEILNETLHIMSYKFGNFWAQLINNQIPQNSLGSKAHSLGQVCTRINYLISGVVNGFTQSADGQAIGRLPETSQFAPLISVGMHCQSLAMIRNYSGHGGLLNASLQTEADARQMLHGLLYVLGKIQICKLFQKS